MNEKIEVSPEQVKSFLEDQVLQARYDLKENLLPNLGHGQKERLLLAIAEYPQNEADFSDDTEYMIRAFSALKMCVDANVALGIHMVDEELQKRVTEVTEGENNG